MRSEWIAVILLRHSSFKLSYIFMFFLGQRVDYVLPTSRNSSSNFFIIAVWYSAFEKIEIMRTLKTRNYLQISYYVATGVNRISWQQRIPSAALVHTLVILHILLFRIIMNKLMALMTENFECLTDIRICFYLYSFGKITEQHSQVTLMLLTKNIEFYSSHEYIEQDCVRSFVVHSRIVGWTMQVLGVGKCVKWWGT